MSEAENQKEKFCNCYYGTRITFLVDTYKCNSFQEYDHKFDLFGYENTLDSMSYFKHTQESSFCWKVSEAINEFTNSAMFKLTYNLNDNILYLPAIYNETYAKILFEKSKRNQIFGKNFCYEGFDFAIDEKGRSIVLWDRKKAILLVYLIDTTHNYICDVFCKCFYVKNANIIIDENNLMPKLIHYFGGDTRDILLFNRDALTSKQKATNVDIFVDGKKVLAAVYKEILFSFVSDKKILEWIDKVKKIATEWAIKRKSEKKQVNLSDNINDLFPNSEYELKKMIIEFSFTILIRSCKEELLSVFNGFTLKEKWNLATGDYVEMYEGVDDTINNNTYFFEFLHEAVNLFDQEWKKCEIKHSLLNIFRQEFFDIYLDYSKMNEHVFYVPGPFGEFFSQRPKMPFSDNNTTKQDDLKIYLYSSLIRIITYLFCLDVDITSCVDQIRPILSYFPGFYSNFGFANVKDFCDIIKSQSHIVIERFYTRLLICYLPLIKNFTCKSIDINDQNELIMNFDNSLPNTFGLKIKDNALKRLLSLHAKSKFIPTIVGFEYIAIDITNFGMSNRILENIIVYNSNVIIMWDDFQNLSDRYSGKIKTQEDINNIILETLPNSRDDIKPALFLLRFICQTKTFDNNVGFEDVWIKVHHEYKEFMRMILNLFVDSE